MRFSPSISYRLHRFSHLTPPTPVKTWSSTALIDAQKDRFARSGQLCRCGALLEGTSVGRWLFLQTFLLVERMRIARSQKQILIFKEREREKAQQSLEEVKGNIWGVSSCYDWSIKFPFGVQRVASSPSLVPTGCSLRYQTCMAQISLQVSQSVILELQGGEDWGQRCNKDLMSHIKSWDITHIPKKTGWLGSKFEGKRVLTWIDNVVFCCYIELHTYEWHF